MNFKFRALNKTEFHTV